VKYMVMEITKSSLELHLQISNKENVETVTTSHLYLLWQSFQSVLKIYSSQKRLTRLAAMHFVSLSTVRKRLLLWMINSLGATTNKHGHLAEAHQRMRFGSFFLKKHGLRYSVVTCE